MSEKKTESFFDKTVFGGYDPEQVDEFVGEARKLLANFKKENEVLKQKLQVLAETIETYRAAEAQSASKAAEPQAASVSDARQSADAAVSAVTIAAEEAASEVVSSEEIAVCNQQIDELNQQITALTAQIDAEQTRLAALRKERVDFAQTLAEQYESKLRELRGEENDNAIEPTNTAENAIETAADQASVSKQVDPAPVSEQIDANHTATAPEPAVEPTTSAEKESVSAAASDIASAIATAPEQAAQTPSKPSAQKMVEPEQAQPVDTAVSQVEAGDSVYLNAGGVDTSNLSYEEALALVLKKNGILPRTETDPVPPAEKISADSQATKIIPRIPAMQSTQDTLASQSSRAAKPSKSDKPKKKGLFRSLKNSIHSFLEEDDDDDDDFMPVPDHKHEEELQFGKAYNVKKDR